MFTFMIYKVKEITNYLQVNNIPMKIFHNFENLELWHTISCRVCYYHEAQWCNVHTRLNYRKKEKNNWHHCCSLLLYRLVKLQRIIYRESEYVRSFPQQFQRIEKTRLERVFVRQPDAHISLI